jgi:hypothetical protein
VKDVLKACRPGLASTADHRDCAKMKETCRDGIEKSLPWSSPMRDEELLNREDIPCAADQGARMRMPVLRQDGD